MPIYVTGWLSIYVSIFLCLVVTLWLLSTVIISPLCNCLVKKVNHGTDVSLINILNCLPHLIFVPKHICTRLTILTSSKNNHKIKVAETLQRPVGNEHAPLGLQIYYFIISENADCIDYLYGEGGRRGSAVKEVARVKLATIISHYYLYIYI